jgi:xanthine dehydrogenase YagR molybdenum-binding subunit
LVELSATHPRLYQPEEVNPSFPADTGQGDAEAAFARAEVQVDETYATAPIHNNEMEPRASLALWTDGDLLVYDSIQGTWSWSRG